jgi:hypothetical protein
LCPDQVLHWLTTEDQSSLPLLHWVWRLVLGLKILALGVALKVVV